MKTITHRCGRMRRQKHRTRSPSNQRHSRIVLLYNRLRTLQPLHYKRNHNTQSHIFHEVSSTISVLTLRVAHNRLRRSSAYRNECHALSWREWPTSIMIWVQRRYVPKFSLTYVPYQSFRKHGTVKERVSPLRRLFSDRTYAL